MSKRNFVLLIIVLVIITIMAFVFFYSSGGSTRSGDEGEGTNFFSKFNPFGKNKNATPEDEAPVDISGYVPDSVIETHLKLRKVSSMPVAGYGVFVKERYKEIPASSVPTTEDSKVVSKKPTAPETEFVSALRYTDRANGNTYQTFADKIDERKFTSTTIPQVYESYFGAKAESVVMRYLKSDSVTISTFAGSLPRETLGADQIGENSIKGSFLPDNIKDMSVSPDLSKLFYLLEIGDGVVGTTSSVQGGTKTQVFSSAFTEWLSEWPTSNLITLTTKPTFNAPGYMYAIDPIKKDFKKVFGGISGLTTRTSPNGKLVLYGNNNLSLGIYNMTTKTSTAIGVKTLPEKCVWTKTSDIFYCAVPRYTALSSYPDSWYKGEESFSDEIWAINAISGNTALILDPLSVVEGEDIDGIKLMLDKDEKYLFFVNKKDSFLWELELQ